MDRDDTRGGAPLVALLLGAGLVVLGVGIQHTLVGLRLDGLGRGSLAVGLVGSAYFTGLLLGAYFTGQVIRTVGHIRAVAAFAAIAAAATIAMAMFDGSVWIWTPLRAAIGFATAGLYTAIESWLNVVSSNETRGRTLSYYMLVTFVALSGGQLLFWGKLEIGDWRLFGLVAILFSLSLVPTALARTRGPVDIDPEYVGLKTLLAISPLSVIGILAAGLANGAFYSLMPVFGASLGLDADGVGLLVFAAIFGGLLLQWPVGKLSDLYDRRQVLVAAHIAMAMVALAVGYGGLAPGLTLNVAAMLFGGLLFSLYPLCVANAADRARPEQILGVVGGLLLSYSVGAALGPIVAAGLMQLFGAAVLFAFTAATATITALAGLVRMSLVDPVPMDEQVAFAPMPRTTAVAAEMYEAVEAEFLEGGEAAEDPRTDGGPA